MPGTVSAPITLLPHPLSSTASWAAPPKGSPGFRHLRGVFGGGRVHQSGRSCRAAGPQAAESACLLGHSRAQWPVWPHFRHCALLEFLNLHTKGLAEIVSLGELASPLKSPRLLSSVLPCSREDLGDLRLRETPHSHHGPSDVSPWPCFAKKSSTSWKASSIDLRRSAIFGRHLLIGIPRRSTIARRSW